jgi:alkylation response protein AidB-like acyl-CoA dehydrogenase
LPGITVRPIIGLDGMHSLNELFLENVRIPVSQRVGEENRGWDLMKVVLGTERISAAGIWKAKAHFERLCAIAKSEIRSGRPLIEQPRFRQRLSWLYLRLQALEEILLSVLADPSKSAGIEASILKLRGTQLQQELLEMISEAAGYYALPFHPDVMREGWGNDEPIGPSFAAPATPFYLFWRKSSISGGANEIMRNMIAHTLLG